MKKIIICLVLFSNCFYNAFGQEVIVDSIVIDLNLVENKPLKNLSDCHICKIEVAISKNGEIAIANDGKIYFLDNKKKIMSSIESINRLQHLQYNSNNDLVGFSVEDSVVTASIYSIKNKNWSYKPLNNYFEWVVLVDSSLNWINKIELKYSVEKIELPENTNISFGSLISFAGDENQNIIAYPHLFVKQIKNGEVYDSEYYASGKYDEFSTLCGYQFKNKKTLVFYENSRDLYCEDLSKKSIKKLNIGEPNVREVEYKSVMGDSKFYALYKLIDNKIVIYTYQY